MKFYLAGAISSNLAGYRAQFAAAADLLRAEGHDVVNPADNPPQPDWLSYMRLSLGQLVTTDGIALLPGWEHSEGARLEAHVAEQLRMPMRFL